MGSTNRKMIAWLVIIYYATHLLICVISGQWWDDWCYWVNGAECLKETYLESGIPLQAYNIISVMWIPNWGYRSVVFFEFLLIGLLFFFILCSLDFISEEDAFWMAAVAMSVPVNDARVLLNCYGYSLTLLIFVVAFYIVTRIIGKSVRRMRALRILSLLCLLYSYTTESLLVFTGLIWLYLFYHILKSNVKCKLVHKACVFLKSYWDYVVLPFAFFIVKRIFIKPYGRYAGYNNVTVKSLIKGMIFSPIATIKTGTYMMHSYLLQIGIASTIVLLGVLIIYLFFEHKIDDVGTKTKSSIKIKIRIFGISFFIYYTGLFAYVVVRGGSALSTTGVGGRDAMLTGFGIGMLIVAFSRLLPAPKKIQNLIPIIFIVLGSFHFNDWYLNYQEDWYHQLEFANAIENIDNFDGDKTILCDFSTASPNGSTRFYSLSGMSYIVTGKMNKFFFSRVSDLRYGISSNYDFNDGYNVNNYNFSDMTINGVLLIDNAPISNTRLLQIRFDELFKPEIFKQ